ncbi:MAG: winged helix-turn-helix domain-containing protein [Candidatus Hadarchaeales archaeon]
MKTWKFLVQEKPTEILLALRTGETYPSAIAKKVETTFAHAFNILSKLERMGLIISEEKGRKRLVRLTERGEELAILLEKLKGITEVIDAYIELEETYSQEVKGKLREEINKEKVVKRLVELRERMGSLAQREDEVGKGARKFLEKVEEVEREVKGLVVGEG